MVICLEQGADLHTAQLMPLPLTVSASVKSRLVLPFWYWFTRVVLDKGPLNGCVCVCVLHSGVSHNQFPSTSTFSLCLTGFHFVELVPDGLGPTIYDD